MFGRLAGNDDANDADRLSLDPAMRAIADRKGLDCVAASTSQMVRFEAQWLVSEDKLAALSELPGAWIQRVHEHKPPKMIVLDMDSSESPTYGASATQFAQPASCACHRDPRLQVSRRQHGCPGLAPKLDPGAGHDDVCG